MKFVQKFIVLIAVSALYIGCSEKVVEDELDFLRTDGQDIVNSKGEKVFLRGVGLGNWLLPEGYMWKFGKKGDRPRRIEKVVEELIGEEKAKNFWKTFRKNYITEADIKRIAELGFNSVRPALNSRLFIKEEGEPEFVDEGFVLLDSLVNWCSKYNIYVIIDMHGAPGGQTGQNIDDSNGDVPGLFTEKSNQDKLVKLWVKIAEKYKNEPIVIAYDLLNEPLPERTGAADEHKHQLVPIYKRLIDEIRKVDTVHMITLEGYNWSNNWSLFDEPLDDNVFYQFHYYCWNRPADNLNSIDYFLKKRDQLNTPVWVGETGEKGNTIYWGTAQYFKEKNIGFSFWPWKKLHTVNTPYSIVKPEQWDSIANYTFDGVKPDSALAERVLNEFLENIKLENCQFFEDVTNMIFNRIPAKIEAENYGHKGYNVSYFVNDTSNRARFYRTAEPVNVEILDTTKRNSEQFVVVNEKEWLVYDFTSLNSEKYNCTLKIKSENASAKILITNKEKSVEREVAANDWQEIKLDNESFNKGENNLKIEVVEGTVSLDWIQISVI